MKAGLALVAIGAIALFLSLTTVRMGGVPGATSHIDDLVILFWLGMGLLGAGALRLAWAGWRGSILSWVPAGLVTGFLVGFANEIVKDQVCKLVTDDLGSYVGCLRGLTDASLGIGLVVAALVSVGGVVLTTRRRKLAAA